MFKELQAKEKAVNSALLSTREVGEDQILSYEWVRLVFGVFLADGHCHKRKTHLVFGEEKPVSWWRGVELVCNDVPYDLVVFSDDQEPGGYGQYAGDLSRAVINVCLNGREG
ncbi:MAG: hypothetical protein WAV56_05255, partial [Microgenomates group bacterium]